MRYDIQGVIISNDENDDDIFKVDRRLATVQKRKRDPKTKKMKTMTVNYNPLGARAKNATTCLMVDEKCNSKNKIRHVYKKLVRQHKKKKELTSSIPGYQRFHFQCDC